MYLGVEKLIGPKVIIANTVTLSGGVATVVFPQPLHGVASDYIILAGGSASHSWASAITVNGFTMNGTGSEVVSYAVIRVNNATVTVDVM